MSLFCPFCTKEIAPETTQCPSCGYAYGPDTLKLLASAIKKASQEYPSERRKHVRIHKTFKIAYPTPKAFKKNYLSDIGTGGLFIKTNNPLNQGEKFNFKIMLPDKKKELKVFCEVIWSNREERVTFEKKIPQGMGVKFLNLSVEDKERIISILSQSAT